MAAFKFKLETLLRHRKNLMDMAQRDFREAEFRLNAQLELIRNLYSQIDEARFRSDEIQKKEAFDVVEINSLEGFITLQYKKIDVEKLKARELMAVVEEKQELLVQAARDHKAIEKLKEKEQARYKAEKNRKERIQIDDIVTTRYAREKAT